MSRCARPHFDHRRDPDQWESDYTIDNFGVVWRRLDTAGSQFPVEHRNRILLKGVCRAAMRDRPTAIGGYATHRASGRT
jgi:hypothetical protein